MAESGKPRRSRGGPSDLLHGFCVEGAAVSWRAGAKDAGSRQKLRAWQETVREAARRAAVGASPYAGAVRIEVSEFGEHRRLDRDNMVKPILDALQTILYENDAQVAGLKVEWYDIEGMYKVRFMPFEVAAALSKGRPFVRIRMLRYWPATVLPA